MGYEKFKRPILASKGLEVKGPSTFSTKVVFANQVRLPTESLTGSTATQTLSAHGVSFITYGTSGKANDFIIPAPPAAGAIKYVHAVNNTTSVELSFHLGSTATVFFGTTANQVNLAAASTGSPAVPSGAPSFTLIGVTTAQWSINVSSTFHWDVVASTGSTSQA